MTNYTIDAQGKTLGRVASQAAKMLMGKTTPDYVPHVRSDVKVEIVNASKISMRKSKAAAKTYTTYTGHPGGLRKEPYARLAARKGVGEPLRRAIERMLPRNTFRTARMKNLTITK